MTDAPDGERTQGVDVQDEQPETVTPAPDAGAHAGERPDLRRRLVALLAPALLAVLALVVVALHVDAYTKVGPVDELQHIDYLYKAPEVVQPGEKVDDDAMEQEACRGIDYPMPLPPCEVDGDYDPADFQENGYNTAAANTPAYYTLTKLVASVIDVVTPGDNLVTDGRLAGGAWLALGLVLAYAAGRRLGVDRVPLTALLAIAACAPSVVYVASTITPDAAGFAVGAGSLLTVLWWEDRPARRWPVLVAVAAVGLAFKLTNVVVLVALGVYVVLRLVDLARGRRAGLTSGMSGSVTASTRSLVLGGVALLVTFVVVVGGWTAYQASLGHPDPMDVPMQRMFTVDAFPSTHLAEHLGTFLDPLVTWIVQVGPIEHVSLGQRIASMVLLTGLVGVALLGDRLSRARTLAQGAVLTGLVGAPAFIVLSYVSQSVYFSPPPRYAATLIPLMAIVTASAVRTRPARVVMVGLAAVALVLTVARLTGA